MDTRHFKVTIPRYTQRNGIVEYHIHTQLQHYGSTLQSWSVRRRYRDLRQMHDSLADTSSNSLPSFPPKKFFGNSSPQFLAQRQRDVEVYLNTILHIDGMYKRMAVALCLGLDLRNTPSETIPNLHRKTSGTSNSCSGEDKRDSTRNIPATCVPCSTTACSPQADTFPMHRLVLKKSSMEEVNRLLEEARTKFVDLNQPTDHAMDVRELDSRHAEYTRRLAGIEFGSLFGLKETNSTGSVPGWIPTSDDALTNLASNKEFPEIFAFAKKLIDYYDPEQLLDVGTLEALRVPFPPSFSAPAASS